MHECRAYNIGEDALQISIWRDMMSCQLARNVATIHRYQQFREMIVAMFVNGFDDISQIICLFLI